MDKQKDNRPYILVYGIDRLGYRLPSDDLNTKNCRLHFEPFDTAEKFQDYDGVILFQGTFETIKHHRPYYRSSTTEVKCYREELQRRKKQYDLLLEKRGFICFLLVDRFIDRADYGQAETSDLAKHALNRRSFYRDNLPQQTTTLSAIRNEFIDFLKTYGAAWTIFKNHNQHLEIKEICQCYGGLAGLILFNKEYFVPTLKPSKNEADDCFSRLSEALNASYKKLAMEIPAWADEFKFKEEERLISKRRSLEGELGRICDDLVVFREYKKCLCYNGELLVESVQRIFKDGFGLTIDPTDQFKEDFKIVDQENKPLVLAEVKGSNKGITRENINQADSHRERTGVGEQFPSILIVNTFIKKSNALKMKYQPVAGEQTKHAVKMGVLVMRTIDLLNMLYFKEAGKLSSEEWLRILTTENGWLETSQESWTIRKT